MPTGADAGSVPDGVPDTRCGFRLDVNGLPSDFSPTCCWRRVWNGTGRCVWHATVGDKPATTLQGARTDHAERLDGATLSDTDIESFDALSGCKLTRADFTNANLVGANFTNALLREADFTRAFLREADFTDATLKGADFSNAALVEANLTSTALWRADFVAANLGGADLTGAHLENANLGATYSKGAVLSDADLSDANLVDADLEDADLTGARLDRADLTIARLVNADLPDTSLEEADLSRTDLHGADLTDAFLGDATFTDANLLAADLTDATATAVEAEGVVLERATLIRTDFFDAELSDARLYGATFNDTKINRRTAFGEPYADALEAAEPGDVDDGGVTPWDKAAWSSRRLEDLARQNALPDRAREAFRRRKDVRREELRYRSGWKNHVEYAYSTASSLVMRYGDSPWRVVGVSLMLIFVSAFLYPIPGIRRGQDESPITYADLLNADLPDALGVLGTHFYFSTVTFTTLGYGDFQPVGWAQLLATVESFLGALLMALLVFVLGRRSTW